MFMVFFFKIKIKKRCLKIILRSMMFVFLLQMWVYEVAMSPGIHVYMYILLCMCTDIYIYILLCMCTDMFIGIFDLAKLQSLLMLY